VRDRTKMLNSESVELLREGDIVILEEGDRVYGRLPRALIDANRPSDWTLEEATVVIGQSGYPPGKYIVYWAGIRNPEYSTIYGYRAACFCQEHKGVKVKFYQALWSGESECVLPDKRAVGRARKNVTWETMIYWGNGGEG
jgi:hypothetical protein